MDLARDLTVEVRIKGKQTRCLVDTGAAVPVLDAKYFSELYGGNLPPLKPCDLDSIRTAWYLVRYRMANKWSSLMHLDDFMKLCRPVTIPH